MYLLYAPKEKFGILPPKTPLITDEVPFINNVAYCPKFFWKKHHILQGCRDVTPHWMNRLRAKRQLLNILIIATGGLGDSMWCMPFVKSLREKYPRSRILVATEERNMPLWQGVPYADMCVKDEFWNLQSLIRNSDETYDFGGIATMLKREMNMDPVEAIFYTANTPLPKNRQDCRPMLVLTVDDGKVAEAMLRREHIETKTDKIIAIALEASTPNRNWPFHYVRLITEQFIHDGYKVIWLSESKDFGNTYIVNCNCGWEFVITATEKPESISFKCPVCKQNAPWQELSIQDGIANLGGKTNVRNAMAIIALCDLFIGPNSGLMVIATALQIPTIGLFGAFNPRLRAKFYDKFIGLMGRAKCAPCNEHWTECREGYPAPCMKMITPNEVYTTAQVLLKNYQRTPIEKRPIT